jgi:hypothetical protein
MCKATCSVHKVTTAEDSTVVHSPALKAVHQLLRLEVPQLQAAICTPNNHLVDVGVWVRHAAGLKATFKRNHTLQTQVKQDASTMKPVTATI